MNSRLPIILVSIVLVSLSGQLLAQEGLPDGPHWGRGAIQPDGANSIFATGNGCALCHSGGDRAIAMRTKTGDDVSPHGLWQSTMMANAFRDPYWRAQVAHEVELAPDRKEEIEALCLTCHAPMVHHSYRIAEKKSPSIASVEDHALAQDGVSCTVCHQAQPEALLSDGSFNGNLDIRPGRIIFGPYPKPATGPMRVHTAYTPTEGLHMKKANLCGSCHTLQTKASPEAEEFPEQAPFLEWSNSVFAQKNAKGEALRTCQECHMPDMGNLRIARAPHGGDFNIPKRPNYRAHAFVGGNAFMLDLFAANAEELQVKASPEAFQRSARASRRQLAEDSARLEIGEISREGNKLIFDVTVRNLTGHKLPTAYPSRRSWLMIDVRFGGTTVFRSGAVDADGNILGPKDQNAEPHYKVITSADQVQIYEAIPMDLKGVPTKRLSQMAEMKKDNRILPMGWKPDGPYAKKTAPRGVVDDGNFVGGKDTVRYEVTLPEGQEGKARVIARMLYQTIPPTWVAPLRNLKAEEAKRFIRMYDAAPKRPEIMGLTLRSEE